MASIEEIKSTLHRYVVETEDIKLLESVTDYFRAKLDRTGKIVGYDADGTPLSLSKYRDQLDEAREQIEKGQSMDQIEVEKAAQKW